ncbi:hypothetical protein [Thermoflexus sp.]|uniref:hypothetical protein n=1 Tax=Thermoflexus sp. TaxID=1969742 RepID=UPI0025DE7A43|nr:hypothetical protein [Thermoflexus sp.]MDW8180112.1 hypothetical protein [Anaerolineae bacterium]MCS6964713.1 hypothetical protein [Thermoflexus sp.]MCS7350661.1 hypothetical protein [Thermoflexus sp.]MCX7690661.1 hypothetical protein [Thermoflexus sp.]MDW8185798.1 hypothetical protein [Anaerolineae bacterium]
MHRHLKMAGLLLLGVTALAFVFSPTLRAAAHDFLQGFRFRRLLVVPYTFSIPTATGETLSRVLGSDIAFEPVEPQTVQSLPEAEAFLGFPVRSPAGVKEFLTLQVMPAASARWTVDVGHLREALHAAGADDVTVPETLHGTVLTITVGPILLATFEAEGTPYGWAQAPLPTYTVQPEGDVRPLAEAALRLIGMPAEEARRLARTVDWQTTLLLPIPMAPGMAVEVESVALGDREATLFTFPQAAHTPSGEALPVRFLLWHDETSLYLIGGPGAEASRLIAWARAMR